MSTSRIFVLLAVVTGNLALVLTDYDSFSIMKDISECSRRGVAEAE
jgi:hypothetical protein